MLDPWLAERQMDGLDLPLHRLLSLVYYWLLKNTPEKKDRDQLIREIEAPPETPRGIDPDEYDVPGWSPEDEMALFNSLR